MDFTLEFMQMFFIALWYASPVVGLLLVVIVILGYLIGIREGWPMADSVYYAFITATTVGYGDFYPKTRLSKTLAIVISLVGLVLTGIVVALALHAAGHAFKSSPEYKQLIDKVEQVDRVYK